MNEHSTKQQVLLLAEILSEMVSEDESSIQERVAKIENLQSVLSYVSGMQQYAKKCTLRYQPVHWVLNPHVCKKDGAHVFCKRHNLDVCVTCGGAFA